MPDLIAQGPQPEQRWRRPLPEQQSVTLGRIAGVWSIAWDERISRQHATLLWNHGRLSVQQVAGSRNPLFYRGQKRDQCELLPGDHFVIGATTFTVVEQRVEITRDAPQPVNERAFQANELQGSAFRFPDQRITALARLPDIISGSNSDSEQFVRLVSVLMAGITLANGAALVRIDISSDIEVLHWDRRQMLRGDFRPSEKLIREAIRSGESIVHLWKTGVDRADFTVMEGVDWAFCTPLQGSCCQGWAIYATGVFPPDEVAPEPESLHDDLKFAEIVAVTFSSLREAQLLARRQAGLSQFLSPVVLEAIGSREPDLILAPREASVSVMFCDLRGFTRRSEQDSGDLLGLLQRVSHALGVMTRHILNNGGVVGDFHGDAAMGFWGWPLPQDDAAQRACRAALAIRTEFEAAQHGNATSLADFRIGIGIASGNAVAGKIGTVDQVKVTVFGPVVNLASRLESLTKTLQAPILLDAPTASAALAHLVPSEASVRRVARIRPLGMQSPIEVSELMPHNRFSPEHIATYENALDSLIAGDWKKAFHALHQVPAEDEVKDFLTVLIAQHGRVPPPGWDGVINLREK